MLDETIRRAISGPMKDAKTTLQEHLQKLGRPLPAYEVVEQLGSAHEPRFVVECRLPDLALVTTGRARDRRSAEQAAAQQMLELMGAVDE